MIIVFDISQTVNKQKKDSKPNTRKQNKNISQNNEKFLQIFQHQDSNNSNE